MNTRHVDFRFSMNGAELFGSFSRRFTFVSLQGQKVPGRQEIQDTARTDLGAAKEMALSRYARLHETRHFHDAFGTIAGLVAFRLNYEATLDFFNFVHATDGKLPHHPWYNVILRKTAARPLRALCAGRC